MAIAKRKIRPVRKPVRKVRRKSRRTKMSETITKPTEFEQLWKIVTSDNKDFMLELVDSQAALRTFVLALTEVPIQDYEDVLEKDADDNDPLEWFNNASQQLMNGQAIEEVPSGWPEGAVYGGSEELRKKHEEVVRLRTELAKSNAARGPRKPREKKQFIEVLDPNVDRGSMAQRISYFVLTHPGMSREQTIRELTTMHPGSVVRKKNGKPTEVPLVNPATVGLHMYLWRDKVYDLKKAFPDKDWSFLGW